MILTKKFIVLICFFTIADLYCQQQADTSFTASIENPLFTELKPVIAIDQLHNNLHTRETGFAPFSKLVRQDGFEVIDFKAYSQLEEIDILVIANPLHSANIQNWKNPVSPAFSTEEVEEISEWVHAGGALLLIADHMPFAGAADILAQKFGFNFCNGFANLAEKSNNRDAFSLENGLLKLEGLGQDASAIEKVFTFTGSGFSYPSEAISLLNFSAADICLLPETAWEFNESTPRKSLENMSQGAIMPFGKGRIAVFGEAAMFTAQIVQQNDNTFKIGFNSPYATDNIRFIRQILKWLSADIQGDLDRESSIDFEEEIKETMRQMETVFNRGEFEEVAEFYTEDAQMIGNKVHIKGKSDLKNYWSKFSGDLEWKLESESIQQLSDDLVLQNGFSNVYFFNQEGQKQNSRSYFSLLWQKENKQWKILLDHFSPR